MAAAESTETDGIERSVSAVARSPPSAEPEGSTIMRGVSRRWKSPPSETVRRRCHSSGRVATGGWILRRGRSRSFGRTTHGVDNLAEGAEGAEGPAQLPTSLKRERVAPALGGGARRGGRALKVVLSIHGSFHGQRRKTGARRGCRPASTAPLMAQALFSGRFFRIEKVLQAPCARAESVASYGSVSSITTPSALTPSGAAVPTQRRCRSTRQLALRRAQASMSYASSFL